VVTFHASQKLKEQIQAGASANRAQV
jgi:hypothetical protein